MTSEELSSLVREIISQAIELKDRHTGPSQWPVNYACIFSQTKDEYDTLLNAALAVGKVVQDTRMGAVLKIDAMPTPAEPLEILKIRLPDTTRPERGDADFTVPDYKAFKATHLTQPGYKLIERPEMEMIELMDPEFSVRAYFSHPPLIDVLGIR